MRIRISHDTIYRYANPPAGVIQTLRMTPRNHDGQYVSAWRIDISSDCQVDAFDSERVDEDRAERIVAHLADEARCSARSPGRDGDIGSTAAPATHHCRRGVGRHVDRAVEMDHDVLYEVTNGSEHQGDGSRSPPRARDRRRGRYGSAR